jgi:hypothetical protein
MGEMVSTGISETGALSNMPLIEELKQQIEILDSLVAEHRP